MYAVMLVVQGETLARFDTLLKEHKATAQPMHPGVVDETLARWHTLHASSPAALEALVRVLQAHPLVEAAYLKSYGETPQ
jgi:hypothetical protein